jgi:pescadillo protein
MDEKAAAAVYKKVTHVVMDRPVPAATLTTAANKAKEFVQPQYLVDAANNLLLLPTRPYKPGVPAPPHLSPFVDNEGAGYVPDRQREINTLAGVETKALADEESSSEEEEEEKAEDMEELRGDADSSSESEAEEKEEKEKPKGKAVKKVSATKLKKDLEEE